MGEWKRENRNEYLDALKAYKETEDLKPMIRLFTKEPFFYSENAGTLCKKSISECGRR